MGERDPQIGNVFSRKSMEHGSQRRRTDPLKLRGKRLNPGFGERLRAGMLSCAASCVRPTGFGKRR
jgi:hypothetical protein